MGRKARQASNTGLYHVIVRGNNKTRIFHSPQDFEQFLKILSRLSSQSGIKIHHYCLMTNHVHLILWSEDVKTLGNFMHNVARSYHHYYRNNYTWFGHLFQGRFRSLVIEEEGYLLDCGRYIERNPVRAKMVKNPKDWEYSSFCAYGYGNKNELIQFSAAYLALSNQPQIRERLYREHVEATRPYEEIIDRALLGV